MLVEATSRGRGSRGRGDCRLLPAPAAEEEEEAPLGVHPPVEEEAPLGVPPPVEEEAPLGVHPPAEEASKALEACLLLEDCDLGGGATT